MYRRNFLCLKYCILLQVSKLGLTLCLLLLLGTLCVDAQRDGRRRGGRRKPTTESPPVEEETEVEKSSSKQDVEPEVSAKASSAQPTESEIADKESSSEKESANNNQGGPPFIVPRGTRKPRPQMRDNGESRPRPTLPSFARKRGPKPQRREFKKNDENVVVSSSTSTTTTKPSRGSSRGRNNNAQDRNPELEKAPKVTETATEPAAPKKRFGGAVSRRPSRGNRRHNAEPQDS